MKLLHCPINGPRPLQEFVFGGEFRPSPPPEQASDRDWAEFVFHRRGEPGLRREWWYHLASGTWFIAERENAKDEITRTYLYSELESGDLTAQGAPPSEPLTTHPASPR